jgi:hypothetical protein
MVSLAAVNTPAAAAQLALPLPVRLRNTALRLLPRSGFTRSVAGVLDWTGVPGAK